MAAIRNAIEKRFDVEDVNVMTIRDTDKLEDHEGWIGLQVQAVYQATAPLISNVSLLVNFDKTVQIEVAHRAGCSGGRCDDGDCPAHHRLGRSGVRLSLP